MNLSFHGASESVTGSKSIIEINQTRLLIDCGMYQGDSDLELKNNESLVKLLGPVDAIILTHAHLDHTGLLPKLVKEGFHGEIFCTHETFELVKIILEDSAKIQMYEFKKGNSARILYGQEDVEQTLTLFKIVERKVMFDNIEIEFFNAGHILGAVSVVIRANNESVCFSGDLGRDDDLLHPIVESPTDVDFLVLESTYGNRLHHRNNPYKELIKAIEHIKEQKGVLLIPAFAIARTQVLIKMLSDLFELSPQLKLPVFVDSPMGVKATQAYRKFSKSLKVSEPEFLKSLEVAKFIEFGNDAKKLAKAKAPFILISSSGMLSGGKVLKYFDMYAHHERNVILITGYQGEGTLGKSLLAGQQEFEMFGHRVKFRAKLFQIASLSAHADQEDLLRYVEKNSQLKAIFLNHGEEEAMDVLKQKLEEKFKLRVIKASKDESYDLGGIKK